ncbi:LysR family transcriptional regulator [Parapusillimonas granuli]|uniref:LysR family transcriptional regulator n=1 Tax=Parapusillimonas granuli TaxID=380911 RepID=A0A853FZX4_9BURK|nr:LysR family transcriptional regulator [Parapusillimonas granuli]MBB5214870.1 DNA-binding transcriptional LysR family regulator [Parapusillimonas granuli]MEB2399934.1 LysR family transcriptional regulator [Alcaligenaceae bacterium]NYT49192.1 LysR family transcriptional regulator [Parapusillimonas granuli]
MEPVHDALRRPLPNVNLKLLSAFMLVAEHKSFRLAADASFRSQSAVTTQIKQLEMQLGVTLFHRTTRQVSLTNEGRQLLESARRAMSEVELGLRRIQEAADLKRGRIFLSCSTTVASTRLAHILAVFEQDYPGVQVYINELTLSEMLDSVRRETVDFGIGPIVDAPEFDFEEILQEYLYALVPGKFMSAAGGSITLSQLCEMPLLLLSPATALRATLDDAAQRLGLTLQTKYQFSQAQTLVSMANAGLGAAILPGLVVPEQPAPNTHTLLIDMEADKALAAPSRQLRPAAAAPDAAAGHAAGPVYLTRKVGLVTLKGRSLSPAASRLTEIVRKRIGGGRHGAVGPQDAHDAG